MRVRVVSWNVHGLGDDREALYRAVRAAEPDLVFVQEAPRRLRWRSRCADLARRCGLFFGAGGAPAIGNLILVGQRVRVLRDRALRFPLTPGRHLRGVAFADCELAGGVRFTAIGTHLGTAPAERAEQAERLTAVLAEQDRPLVLGADLNEPPGGPVWSQLTGAKLDDPADGSGSATYPASGPRRRLDTLLLGGCGAEDYTVIDSDDTRRASDHLPVLATISLPG